MRQILDGYTNTDAIRATIGLTDNEVSDEDILNRDLSAELEDDLDDWLPDHGQIFSTGQASSPSNEARRAYNALRLYSKFFCGYQLLYTGSLAVPQIISDGKSEIRRQADINYGAIKDRCYQQAMKYRTRLETVSRQPLMARAEPSYDPVTNT